MANHHRQSRAVVTVKCAVPLLVLGTPGTRVPLLLPGSRVLGFVRNVRQFSGRSAYNIVLAASSI
eukprot:953926-Rhodomonas_salina.1